MTNKYYWRCLFAAIALEVVGTSIMKLSQDSWPILGMGVMYVLLGLSYFYLARAVLKLPIGVSYVFWEGFGLVLITLVGVVLLGESLGALRLVALGLILTGALFVHHGTDSGEGAAPLAQRGV